MRLEARISVPKATGDDLYTDIAWMLRFLNNAD
jgi:hypothetical protein